MVSNEKHEKMLVNFYELVDGLVRIYHSVDIYLVVLLTSCLLGSFLVPRISHTLQHMKMKGEYGNLLVRSESMNLLVTLNLLSE